MPRSGRTGAETRAEVQRVALALFSGERGYDGASPRDIADAIGINKASLYYYFPGKEDILRSVLQSRSYGGARARRVAGGAADRTRTSRAWTVLRWLDAFSVDKLHGIRFMNRTRWVLRTLSASTDISDDLCGLAQHLGDATPEQDPADPDGVHEHRERRGGGRRHGDLGRGRDPGGADRGSGPAGRGGSLVVPELLVERAAVRTIEGLRRCLVELGPVVGTEPAEVRVPRTGAPPRRPSRPVPRSGGGPCATARSRSRAGRPGDRRGLEASLVDELRAHGPRSQRPTRRRGS